MSNLVKSDPMLVGTDGECAYIIYEGIKFVPESKMNKLIDVVKEIHNQACQHDEGISSLWLENMTQDILKEMGELK